MKRNRWYSDSEAGMRAREIRDALIGSTILIALVAILWNWAGRG